METRPSFENEASRSPGAAPAGDVWTVSAASAAASRPQLDVHVERDITQVRLCEGRYSSTNRPSASTVTPSALSRPPARRSQIMSQWTADSFMPPVSG